MNGSSGHADDDREQADAAWLVQDDADPSRPSQPEPATPAEAGYEVVGADETQPPARSEPSSPTPPRASAQDAHELEQPARSAVRAEERPSATAARVDPTWSRWGEWWPTLLSLGTVGLLTIALAYVSFDLDNLVPALAIVFVGGVTALVLSYPIVITMERPVRVTPEQAVNDYFGALCHHRPHFRRMWLLLSTEGRICGEYGSFDGFKAYWTRTLDEFRAGRASRWTPLVFRIVEFDSEKSAGKSEIDVTFSVAIFARGQRNQGPITTVPVAMSLVRGPDRMWYLNRGTLPRQAR